MRKNEIRNFWLPLITATAFLVILAINAPCCFGAECEDTFEPDIQWYIRESRRCGDIDRFCNEIGIPEDEISFYQTYELHDNPDILTTREGVVVEIVGGVVLDENQNGRVENTPSKRNYISYDGVMVPTEDGGCRPCTTDDIIITYCLYDPCGQGEDDIVRRYDCAFEGDLIESAWISTDGNL